MLILDTHAWIWWMNESPRLSSLAKKAIVESEKIGVSIMSCWEVAMLVSKQRLGLSLETKEWLSVALSLPRVELLPLNVDIVTESSRLPGGFHGDPVDRLIVSTCLHYGARLISVDHKIKEWGQIEVLG